MVKEKAQKKVSVSCSLCAVILWFLVFFQGCSEPKLPSAVLISRAKPQCRAIIASIKSAVIAGEELTLRPDGTLDIETLAKMSDTELSNDLTVSVRPNLNANDFSTDSKINRNIIGIAVIPKTNQSNKDFNFALLLYADGDGIGKSFSDENISRVVSIIRQGGDIYTNGLLFGEELEKHKDWKRPDESKGKLPRPQF